MMENEIETAKSVDIAETDTTDVDTVVDTDATSDSSDTINTDEEFKAVASGDPCVRAQTFTYKEAYEPDNKEPYGIGGWLVLIAIGRIISPFLLLVTLFTTSFPPFFNGTLNELSQPGNAVYSALWMPTFLYELIVNIVMLIFGILLLFLLFGKKKSFPNMMIALLIATVVFAVIEAILASSLQKSISVDLLRYGSVVSSATAIQIVSPLINAAIWIPYFLVSERVKNTFIK